MNKLFSKKRKTKADWIKIAINYYREDGNSLTQKDFARINNLNYKSFNDAMNRYRNDITRELDKLKARDSSLGINKFSRPVERPLTIAEQFLNSATTNHRILSTKKSLRWYQDTIKKTVGNKSKMATPATMRQGKLYTYAYDPLTKEKMEYWDQFPLIIFMGLEYGETTKRVYFRGINLHYLPPPERVRFMTDLLANHATTSNLMKNTRLNVNWEDFKNHPLSGDIVKNYLPGHIRSPIREIEPSEWLNIIKLPLQKFTNSDFNSNEEELKI